jgi:hypothetical protein
MRKKDIDSWQIFEPQWVMPVTMKRDRGQGKLQKEISSMHGWRIRFQK